MWKNCLLTTLLSVVLLCPPDPVSARIFSDAVSEQIRERVHIPDDHQLVCWNELLCGSSALQRFYAGRSFRPAWMGESGPLPQAFSLIAAIGDATQEGLTPKDYHLKSVTSLLKRLSSDQAVFGYVSPAQTANLDLLLTDTFLMYASHLLTGRVNPETLQPEWFIKGRKRNVVEVLEAALEQNSIEESLNDMHPPHEGYERLKEALARFRRVAEKGGWPRVSDGPPLRQGDRGIRVAKLRSYLEITGDLDFGPNNADRELFDTDMEIALRWFQVRHGLKGDGVAGTGTLAAINVPVADRIRQLEVNLERWRWLPEDLGERYIQVNIADFSLSVMENNLSVLEMRAIVGKDDLPTPVFTDRITYLELNPYWNIPLKIAAKEILPDIRKNARYLTKNNIRVLRGWGTGTVELDPYSINWSKVSEKYFPFRLRQDPGKKNPLGGVKFVFPNMFSVYIHGTPYHSLFDRESRGFSHGCIRIEKPLELAEYLLEGSSRWNGESLKTAVEAGKNLIIPLSRPAPVHILYFTAWVSEDGTVNFRDDIYGLDRTLAQALGESAPQPRMEAREQDRLP